MLANTGASSTLWHAPQQVDVATQRFLTALCVLGGIREPIAVGCQVEYIGEGGGDSVGSQDKKEDCFIVNYNIADHTATIIDKTLTGHLRTVNISSIRLPSSQPPSLLQPLGPSASPAASPSMEALSRAGSFRRLPSMAPGTSGAPSVGTEFEKLLHALEQVMQHRKGGLQRSLIVACVSARLFKALHLCLASPACLAAFVRSGLLPMVMQFRCAPGGPSPRGAWATGYPMWMPALRTGGGGGFVKGQFRGEIFVFHFRAGIFRTKIVLRYLGYLLLPGLCSWWGIVEDLRGCSLFFLSDELVLFKI